MAALGYQVMREKDGWKNPQKPKHIRKTTSIKQTEHMSSIRFGKPRRFLCILDGRGQSGAWGDADGSLQVSNDGEARHIQNVDLLLLLTAGGWLNPYSF